MKFRKDDAKILILGRRTTENNQSLLSQTSVFYMSTCVKLLVWILPPISNAQNHARFVITTVPCPTYPTNFPYRPHIFYTFPDGHSQSTTLLSPAHIQHPTHSPLTLPCPLVSATSSHVTFTSTPRTFPPFLPPTTHPSPAQGIRSPQRSPSLPPSHPSHISLLSPATHHYHPPNQPDKNPPSPLLSLSASLSLFPTNPIGPHSPIHVFISPSPFPSLDYLLTFPPLPLPLFLILPGARRYRRTRNFQKDQASSPQPLA